ncbi:MAG: hypothetical protein QM796_02805 [Chthoniobacteraceae bacterium]
MTPGRLWWLLRRDWKRGVAATYHDYVTLGKIRAWKFPTDLPLAPEVTVHTFTGAKDWRLGAWMLASFTHFTGLNWRIIVHEDGSLPTEAAIELRRLFPRLEIVTRARADEQLRAVLAPYPLCTEFRATNPLALKLFDMPHFAPGRKFLLLDSDVLFFRRPQEILDWAASEEGGCWFNRDVSESSLVSAEEARTQLGTELWPQVNSGLCCIDKTALDHAFCEKVLAETTIRQGHFWRIEQTLFALCASHARTGGLLPPTYEVSLQPQSSPGIIARHYVGAVRQRFYAEGLPRLQSVLLGA